MSDKSISAALRQVIQKLGDKGLAGKRPSREDIVSEAKNLSNMGRGSASRSWGDQKREKAPKS
jgi:hypothetical protein